MCTLGGNLREKQKIREKEEEEEDEEEEEEEEEEEAEEDTKQERAAREQMTSASLLLDCYWILHVLQPSDWTFREGACSCHGPDLVCISFLISFFPGLDSLAMSMPISQPSHATNV